ncbi:MAG: hypothetical protein ACJ8FY_28085 [Gemmataceae bacterium]
MAVAGGAEHLNFDGKAHELILQQQFSSDFILRRNSDSLHRSSEGNLRVPVIKRAALARSLAKINLSADFLKVDPAKADLFTKGCPYPRAKPRARVLSEGFW